MLGCACGRGGTASIKIWVKTRKIVGSASLLFRLHSSFYTSRGGDRRPQFAVWRVGVSRQIVTLTSILVYVFAITPLYVKQILDGVKNSNDSKEKI
jgi:hypothetical protein